MRGAVLGRRQQLILNVFVGVVAFCILAFSSVLGWIYPTLPWNKFRLGNNPTKIREAVLLPVNAVNMALTGLFFIILVVAVYKVRSATKSAASADANAIALMIKTMIKFIVLQAFGTIIIIYFSVRGIYCPPDQEFWTYTNVIVREVHGRHGTAALGLIGAVFTVVQTGKGSGTKTASSSSSSSTAGQTALFGNGKVHPVS